MAFFQPGLRPFCIPRRLGLAGTLAMFTLRTWTSNSSSTACRTCSRCASLWTLNVYRFSSIMVVALLRHDRSEQDLAGVEGRHYLALPSSRCSALSVASTERAQTSSATSVSADVTT